MTKSATLALHPSHSLLERFLAFLDYSAELAAHNGDATYCGL